MSAEAEDVRYTIRGFGVPIKNDFEVSILYQKVPFTIGELQQSQVGSKIGLK